MGCGCNRVQGLTTWRMPVKWPQLAKQNSQNENPVKFSASKIISRSLHVCDILVVTFHYGEVSVELLLWQKLFHLHRFTVNKVFIIDISWGCHAVSWPGVETSHNEIKKDWYDQLKVGYSGFHGPSSQSLAVNSSQDSWDELNSWTVEVGCAQVKAWLCWLKSPDGTC